MQQREYKNTHATNFTVARLKHNILANSDIGVVMMDKEVKDSAQFNRVVGADANFRFGQGTTFNTFLAKGSTPDVKSDNLDGRVAAAFQNRTWNFAASYTNVQQNFFNEMGYMPRRGVQRLSSNVRWTIRPKSTLIRQIFPHLVLDYFADTHRNFDSKYIDYHFPINFQNGAQLEIGKNPTVEVIRKEFTFNNGKNVVPAGTYSYYDYFFYFRGDPSRKFQPQGRWGNRPVLYGIQTQLQHR